MFTPSLSVFMTSPVQPRTHARILTRIALAFATLTTAGVFHSAHATYPGENGVIVFEAGTIKRVSPGQSAVTDLTPGFGGLAPRVSPNGKKIVFRSSDTQQRVYVMNIDGSNRLQLTDFPVMSAAWLPDGAKLAYTYPVGAWVQLWTMNPDGTGKTFVRNLVSSISGTPGYGLAWSPSGNIYTFGEHGLYIADDVNPGVRTLSSVGSKSSWAPDGASILFRNDTSFGLYAINPDGSDLWMVESAGVQGVTAISPDGKLIAGGIFPNNQPQLATRIRAGTVTTFSWPIPAIDTDWSRVPKNCYTTTPQDGGGVLAGDVDFYASQCAIAVMPYGDPKGVLQQAIAIGPDQRLYHRILKTSPSGGAPIWTGFARVPGLGGNPNGISAKKIAIAPSRDGSAQVVIINAADNAVYHAMRQANGTWSGFNQLDGASGAPNFQARDVAIAINLSTATSPGTAQVIVNGLVQGSVFHRVRSATGNWTPFLEVPGAAGMNTREIAIAAGDDGYTNILATLSTNHGFINKIMHVLGTPSKWTDWVTVGIPAEAVLSESTDVAVARSLAGVAHMMFTDATGNAFYQVRPTPTVPTSWQLVPPTVTIANTAGRAVSISAGATATSMSAMLLTSAFPQ